MLMKPEPARLEPIPDIPDLLHGYHLITTYDTEYVRPLDEGEVPDKRNNVVSYQFAVMNPATGGYNATIVYPKGPQRAQRLSLSQFMTHVISFAQDMGILRLSENAHKTTFKVNLVCHFSRADIPAFVDYRRLKRRFDVVRGTYCTIENPCITEVVLVGGKVLKVSIDLTDTTLLAPVGNRSLAALGASMNFPKATLPMVMDETCTLVPGITRADLCRIQCPDEFELYAVQDVRVTLLWLVYVARFARELGAPGMAKTLGSAAANTLVAMSDIAPLAATLGLHESENGMKLTKDFREELAATLTLVADTFHGARNECFAVGDRYATEELPFNDVDLKGAYPVAQAYCRPIEWDRVEHTKNIDELAVLDRMTFASVAFQFPPDTKFPSLPCDGDGYGLVYPHSGKTVVTGAELLVAASQGATFKIHAGVRLPWLNEDGPRPFVDFVVAVNKLRGRYPKGSPQEKLAKTVANSLYGKTAQGIAAFKSTPEIRNQFNSRTGGYKALKPSKIGSPHVAGYTTGLVRALISEILARLPPPVTAICAVTDGIFSNATPEEMQHALSGPIADLFRTLRAMVDPKGCSDLTEVKHQALAVRSCRTRALFTITPFNGSALIISRGGHHADQKFDTREAESQFWMELVANREPGDLLEGRVFIKVREQWLQSADLMDEEERKEIGFCYDLKRRPVTITDVNGLICFDTVPWASIDDFFEWRRAFDRWKKSTKSILKTKADWDRFVTWKQVPRRQMAGHRTPFEQALVVAFAKGLPGFPIRSGKSRPKPGDAVYDIATIAAGIGRWKLLSNTPIVYSS